MEIMELSQEDMNASQGGGKSWDHGAIQSFLNEAFEQQDGDQAVVGVKLPDVAEEWYEGTEEELKDLKYTNPNVVRTILNNMEEAGFSKHSELPDRKFAVGCETQSDGTVVYKIELNPAD